MTTDPKIPGFPVTVRFPMQWGEMDALGHANNIRYFAWFEAARIAYFMRVGIEHSGSPQIGAILAATSCDFLQPVVYPAELTVGARVTKVGNTSFTMEYAVTANDGPIAARGGAVVVLFNYATGEKSPIPAEMRRRIEALAPS